MDQMTSNFHHNLISMRETFPEILVKIRRDDVMLRHMTSLRKWRHLKNDVMWRHHVGFLQKFQEMFLSLILTYGENLKSLAQFKRELWIFFHIMTSSPKMLTSAKKCWLKTWNQLFLKVQYGSNLWWKY